MAFHQLLCGAIEGHAEEQVGSLHGQAARQASSALMADVMVYLEELEADGYPKLQRFEEKALPFFVAASVGGGEVGQGGYATEHAVLYNEWLVILEAKIVQFLAERDVDPEAEFFDAEKLQENQELMDFIVESCNFEKVAVLAVRACLLQRCNSMYFYECSGALP